MFGNGFLVGFDHWVDEFLDAPTAPTNKMIMVFIMIFLAELLRSYLRNSVTGQPWSLQPLALAGSSMLFWPLCVLAAQKLLGRQWRA